MITIDASEATSGIDFEAFIRGGFVSDATIVGYPVFDNSAAFSGSEVFFRYGNDPEDKYVLAQGDIEYDFSSTHIVYGTIDTIEFGYIGEGSFNDDGAYEDGNVQVSITGLNFSSGLESSGIVNVFSRAYSAASTASQADLDAVADALDTEAQHFIGSDYDDVFTGTAFDDIIEGNDGNDLLAGNGGSDLIDGGDGNDTATFLGVQADYNITRYADGTVVVSKSSDVAAGAEETTLTNIETIAFDDQSATVDDLEVAVARGRITIDASQTNGVDYPAYIEAFFAQLGSGEYAFHGGTEDNYYGRVFYLNGSQMSYAYQEAGDTEGPFVKAVVLEGVEIAYDYIHHGSEYGHEISGQVDTLTFGTLNGDQPESGPDLLTGFEGELFISGLGLNDAPDAGSGPVNDLYGILLSGDAEALETFLSEYAQDFIGSESGDTFVGTFFDDTAVGDRGNDDLDGSGGNDELVGGRGKDTIDGGIGEDTIVGGRGRDILTGGADADQFVFKGKKASGYKASKRDKIKDFSTDDGDMIDLTGFGGLDFIGTKKFSGVGDEIRIIEKSNKTIVKVSVDSDNRPEFGLTVKGVTTLTEDDFLL